MINIYKPNKGNTGFAFTFQIGVDKKNSEPVLYVGSIAQHSWDDSKRLGSFSENKNNPEKNIHVKFNEFECGEIVSSIKNRFEFSAFHSHGENKTIIKLIPWDKPVKASRQNPKTKKIEEYTITKPAFGLSVTRNGNQTFKIPLEAGEVECVRVLIENLLSDLYKQRLDKVKAKIAQPKKESSEPDF
jgi:hypothetical protein